MCQWGKCAWMQTVWQGRAEEGTETDMHNHGNVDTEAKTNMRRKRGLCDEWLCRKMILIWVFGCVEYFSCGTHSNIGCRAMDTSPIVFHHYFVAWCVLMWIIHCNILKGSSMIKGCLGVSDSLRAPFGWRGYTHTHTGSVQPCYADVFVCFLPGEQKWHKCNTTVPEWWTMSNANMRFISECASQIKKHPLYKSASPG